MSGVSPTSPLHNFPITLPVPTTLNPTHLLHFLSASSPLFIFVFYEIGGGGGVGYPTQIPIKKTFKTMFFWFINQNQRHTKRFQSKLLEHSEFVWCGRVFLVVSSALFTFVFFMKRVGWRGRRGYPTQKKKAQLRVQVHQGSPDLQVSYIASIWNKIL